MHGEGDAARRLRASLLADEDVEAQASADVEVVRLSYSIAAAASGRRRAAPAMRTVLSEVSCAFPPGRLSAIMGASGSGKTSLLTLLRGLSAPRAVIEGEVLCNGRRAHIEQLRKISSAVPQEGVFLSALTPREMLSFACELRLPAKWTSEDRSRRVDILLQQLRLESCASTPIGDESLGLRGISGGERRRLSIGLSIVGGLPQLLLCDEPTSGLDSAGAAAVVGILGDLAARGVTVICSIHQPSFDIFRQFSSLLLLEAGRTVYFGSVARGTGGSAADGVEAYFERHGSPVPEHTNPAHHYISEVQTQGDLWAQRWAAAAPTATPRKPSATSASGARTPRAGARAPRGCHGGARACWRQASILTRRTVLENFKNRKKFFRGIMSRLPVSTLIGCFFWRMGEVPTQRSVHTLKGVFFVAVQSPLIETFYAGAAATQLTRGLMKREYYDGLYSIVPYYVSYYLGFLAMQLPWTLAWCIPLYLLVGLPLEATRLGVFLLTEFILILMACSAGSFVGTWTKDADGNRAVLMPLFIPLVLFSGYVIPFSQIPALWRVIYFASPLQWAISILETNRYRGLVFEDCDGTVPRHLRHCYATGEELLEETTTEVARWLGLRGMLLVCTCYTAMFMVLNIRALRRCVLNGGV